MSDVGYLTVGEFLVALLMSLAALSALVWAAASGVFRDVEAIKHRVLELEEEEDHARRTQ
jgi:cbb3-type cytochrome oxidase maturation protein